MATLSQTRRAFACAGLALVQLAAAVTAGFSFIETGCSLLTGISCALTCIILLVNRWFFRGWRERVLNRSGSLNAKEQ